MRSVQLLGHEAKIESISPAHIDRLTSSGLTYKEDRLSVFLSFKEKVKELSSFSIILPVKEYTEGGFLKVVQKEGEKKLKAFLEKTYQTDVRMEADDKKETELYALIARISKKIM